MTVFVVMYGGTGFLTLLQDNPNKGVHVFLPPELVQGISSVYLIAVWKVNNGGLPEIFKLQTSKLGLLLQHSNQPNEYTWYLDITSNCVIQ